MEEANEKLPEERQAAIDKQITRDVSEILSTVAGRQFVWHLLEHSQLFSTPVSVTSSGVDSKATLVNVGLAGMGQYIRRTVMSTDRSVWSEFLDQGGRGELSYLNYLPSEDEDEDND